ncbi:MAG: hypothetical protein LUQ38_07450 [Methanotrichaceae archaeon]|nr:hypothetical protein [Methanotrichaceae archaeon]
MVCEDIVKRINDLDSERKAIAEKMKHASPQEKAELVKEYGEVNRELSITKAKLKKCYADNGQTQFGTTLSGTVTINISYRNLGTFFQDVTLGLSFEPGRHNIVITSFPEIVVGPFSTPLGDNVTTISKISGGGSFNKDKGEFRVTLVLNFDHSIHVPFYEEDSTIALFLTTDAIGGAPLDRATNQLTLVGEGTFQGGVLGGSTAALTISGTLADLP